MIDVLHTKELNIYFVRQSLTKRVNNKVLFGHSSQLYMAMQPEPVGPAQGSFFGLVQRRTGPGWWKVLIWLEGGWIAYLKTTNQLEQFD